MKITVTTTSQSLEEIMGGSFAELASDAGPGENRLTFRNNSTQTVYIEIGEDATVANGFPLEQDDWIEIPTYKIDKINLISDGADNTDIRLLNS